MPAAALLADAPTCAITMAWRGSAAVPSGAVPRPDWVRHGRGCQEYEPRMPGVVIALCQCESRRSTRDRQACESLRVSNEGADAYTFLARAMWVRMVTTCRATQ